jgi:hypothetical protein
MSGSSLQYNQQAIGRELLGLGVVAKSQGDFVRALEFYDFSRERQGSLVQFAGGNKIALIDGNLGHAVQLFKSVPSSFGPWSGEAQPDHGQ